MTGYTDRAPDGRYLREDGCDCPDPWCPLHGEPPERKDDRVVLGCCPHGVDLDRDFCPKGCRV